MWDESVNGDLSNDRLAPSLLLLQAGSNIVLGGFGAPDLDYITLVVPAGHVLASIVTGTHDNVGLSNSFLGVQQGSVMTVPPSAANAAGLLGWAHFRGQSGVDLLPTMATPRFGSTGFTPPLPSAAYTFWINETLPDPGLLFELDFRVEGLPVQEVPLPAAMWLLGAGLMALTGVARTRAKLGAA
jgi:hypothetical protein